MRIISKTHDYYDCIQKYGLDPKINFKRKYEEHPIENINKLMNDYRDVSLIKSFKKYTFTIKNKYSINIDFYIIGFCDNIYPLINIKLHNIEGYMNEEVLNNYYYNIESIKELIEEYKLYDIKIDNAYYLMKRNVRKFKKNYIINSCEQFYDINFDWSKQYFSKYKTPIFTIDLWYNKLHINNELKSYDFYKIKSPHEAFFDISYYISGVLRCNEPDIINISDKDMLYKKGFNNKSFKKESIKNKKKEN